MTNTDIILKLLLAVAVGGALGMERELRSKSAGFRTIILICLGATLFTIFSQLIGTDSPSRIASNIVVGIGFVGAGIIFKSGTRVNGVTTASSVWVTAALGMGIGAGYYAVAVAGCVVTLVVLFGFTYIEHYIDRVNQVRNYKITYPYEENQQHKYEDILKGHGLKIRNMQQHKKNNIIEGYWLVQGRESRHRRFIEAILHDETVTEFEF